MDMDTRDRFEAGFTLLEVLIGIIIFAMGMLALAQLQGNLSKNSADANARTVAANIAEETIESWRTFSQVTASADPDVDAFNNIVSGESTLQRGGIDYTLTSEVTDYYYNRATGGFQTNKPDTRIVNADLKRVELTVSWGNSSFQVDGSNATDGLGTGSVTLVDLISSFTTNSGAKVVLNSYGDGLYSPPVDYNPGENPDIISIELGDNKFKESTTPLPDVIRTDELVETRFDVVTYSQDDEGATFLRREEFRTVSCECTLRLPQAAGEGGLRPTIWEGYEYTEAEWVAKPYGENANNIQSQFCDLCCRDHHDGGIGENDEPLSDPGRSLYNPFRSAETYYQEGALAGDHKHYRRDRQGNLILAAGDGDRYLEACRMVRKNGFFRIAQDLRQEGLNAFPADYLDEEAEVAEYSGYVTGAVSAYEAAMGAFAQYEGNPPLLTQPEDMVPALVFPASTPENPSEMATGGVEEQQLRSRGIYIDYMSDALREKINCLDLNFGSEACETPGVTTSLEIIPFYDVQLTWLARWNETPINFPIDVTNQAIADNNAHSRGVATLEAGFGPSEISSDVHSGNLGLTGTDPIDPWYADEEESYILHALAVDFDVRPAPSNITVSGTISSAVAGVRASDVEIAGFGAQCDRTNVGFKCVVNEGADAPRIEISNYFKPGLTLLACTSDLAGIPPIEHFATNGRNLTKFALPTDASVIDVSIVIKQDSCL